MARRLKPENRIKELKKWVGSALSAGRPEKEVRRGLLAVGWSEADVEQVLPAPKPSMVGFVFLAVVFVSIGITFAMYISMNDGLRSFINTELFTGSAVSAEASDIMVISATHPKVNMTFSPRLDKKDLPLNWFIASGLNADSIDKRSWTWTPLDDKKPGALVANLGELFFPSQFEGMPHASIYSKPIDNNGDAKYAISFTYLPEFTGECLQVGLEILFPPEHEYYSDTNPSDTTYMMNLNEFGESTFTDFDFTAQNIDGKISVDAVSKNIIPDGRKVVLYIRGTCNKGVAYFEDFTVSRR